ncbi:MAG: four-carbon acid sugar kinase family protein [Candidatus Dadabacteria bacterium]
MKKLLLAYYGDDFTGSTDALEFISRAGLKSVLFIEPPTKTQLDRYPDLDAIGVAGMSRSLSPTEMEQILPRAFQALKEMQPKHVHYKVCSTFDSSPKVGSIGKAIDIAAEVFNSSFIPLLVAAPILGRYSVFGNLFARMGIGSDGDVYRLDRHPSMSKHPITPADESDICLHLAKQTKKQIGLLDILNIQQGKESCITALEGLKDRKTDIILFDALYQQQLQLIGDLIDTEAESSSPLFSVGSSGIEMALGASWNKKDVITDENIWEVPSEASSILVLSGSCSPVTAGQIKWAKQQGFKELEIDAGAVANHKISNLVELYCSQAIDCLQHNQSVIIHTGGTSNKTIVQQDSARLLGTFLGMLGHSICKQKKVERLVIAGGDTSSYAARALGIEAVEMIAPLVPGAPLCKAYAPGSPVDNIELNFKGGQVGAEDFFELLRRGSIIKPVYS